MIKATYNGFKVSGLINLPVQILSFLPRGGLILAVFVFDGRLYNDQIEHFSNVSFTQFDKYLLQRQGDNVMPSAEPGPTGAGKVAG